jgi:acid phosphatase family membrane protein YuiD
MRARILPLRYRPTTDSIAIAIVHTTITMIRARTVPRKSGSSACMTGQFTRLKFKNAQKEKNNDNRQHDADQQEQPVLIH